MINFFKHKKNKKLFIKSVSGNLTEEEKTNLEALLQNEENKNEFEEINSLWKISLPNESDNQIDIDTEWTLLQNRINAEEKNRRKVSEFSPSQKKAAYLKPAFAAVVVLLIIAALFLFNFKEEIKYQTISTVNKEIKEVKLPDGSIVNLNSASSLIFPENFYGEKREVELIGEAFFSVTKSREPFIIITENAEVTVLGTKFNVYGRENKTEVFVKEGSVNFAHRKNPGKKVKILPNQSSLVIKNNQPSSPVNKDEDIYLDWLEGKLVFRETTLIDIIAELERHYNVKITLSDKINIYTTISGSFEEEKIEDVLNMICLASELKFTKNDNNYAISLIK